MRSRAGLVVVLGGALALHCGGKSSSSDDDDDVVVPGGNGGSAGKASGGGKAGVGGTAGTAGLVSCDDCAAGESSVGGGDGGVSGSSGIGGGKAQAGSGGQGASSGRGGTGAGSGGRGGVSGAGGSAGAQAGASPGGRANGGSAGGGTPGAAGESGSEELGLHKVAIYQAVEIPLTVDGEDRAPNANAPLIADREAMLRVWLAPGAAFEPRQITADITVTAGSATRTTRSVFTVSGASSDASLQTTLNFELTASEVTNASTVSFVLREDTPSADVLARWPQSGERALEAQSSHGPFLVTVVPLVANGYTPDTSETIRLRFERYMAAIYPASSVEVSVVSPFELDYSVYADGTGWDDALNQLLALRDSDRVNPNVYYYGLLTPGATFDDYCQGDCVVGLSNVAGRAQEAYRGSVGTGYFESSKDTFSQETMGHELGHALGREHSPCGTSDGEKAFPYKNGYIGVWGYDSQRLFDPAKYTDVMGYCVPVWISDYTFDHIFERIVYVNGLVARSTSQRRVGTALYRMLRVGIDGGLKWGRDVATEAVDDTALEPVDLLGDDGHVVRTIAAPFAPYDHLPGGSLSVPLEALADPDVTRVRAGGQTLDVR